MATNYVLPSIQIVPKALGPCSIQALSSKVPDEQHIRHTRPPASHSQQELFKRHNVIDWHALQLLCEQKEDNQSY